MIHTWGSDPRSKRGRGDRRPGKWAVWPTAVLLVATSQAAAQDHGDHARSPYAGAGSEQVQTLAADEVAGLLEGDGMGLARAAEMNGYPGPRHVLDLADSLALTDEQRARTQQVFDRMHRRAVEAGRQIVDAERVLDRAFAEGATAAHLQQLVHDLARLRGALRWVHLRAHLELAQVLSTHQRHEYDRLRGYRSDRAR